MKTYRIEPGDTLQSISEKFGITPVELKAFHNTHCDLKDLIGGNDLPKHLNEILIDENWKEVSIELIKSDDDKEVEKIEFEQQARYRCEQLNITRIEDDVKSYSELKKEYEVNFNLNNNIVSVKLNDFYYELNPPALSRIFDFISEVDYIRNNCILKLNDQGRFLKIINKKTQSENWTLFKNNKLEEIEFIKIIKQSNPNEFNNLIQQGNIQFSDTYDDSKVFNRDLFYFVLLDKYLYNSSDNLKSEIYNYQSQLFPEVIVPMNLRYDVIKIEDDNITVRKVWETIESSSLIEEISNAYLKYHQPLIKYKFTKYKLDMRSLITYNKKTKIIENAELNIIENIENNIKSECIFNMRKIER